MKRQRGLGDRRGGHRFEILGPWWGSLEIVERLELVDLSTGGALLHANVPLAPEAVHRFAMEQGGVTADLEGRVRHSRPDPDVPGAHLVGVEFIGLSSRMEDRLGALVSAALPATDGQADL